MHKFVGRPGGRIFGRAVRRPGEMTRLELQYSDLLESRRLAGEISEFAYEPESLKAGEGARYTPDFRVIDAAGLVWFVEVKPATRSGKTVSVNDSISKLRACAALHPYRFRLATKSSGSAVWTEIDI